MIIKRYKHRPAEARTSLHIVGKVKIGSRDFAHPRTASGGRQWFPPIKLDHFEVVRTLKSDDAAEAFLRDDAVMKAIGDAPDRIQVYLTHNPSRSATGEWDFSGIFEASHLCFRKFAFDHDPKDIKAKGGLLRRFCFGDGETAQRLQPNGTYASCPCDPATCEFPNATPAACKPRGRLFFMLKESGISGGVYVFETGSQRAIESFYAALTWFAVQLGGRLTYVPFTLGLYKEKAQRPDGQATKVWRVYLEGPSIEEMGQYLQRALASAEIERKLLGAPVEFSGSPAQAIAEIAGPIATEYEQVLAENEDLESADDGVEAQNGHADPTPPSAVSSPPPATSEKTDVLGGGEPWSPDPDENALAERLCNLVTEICNATVQPFEKVMRDVTRKPNKEGVESIKRFFQYKGIDDAMHTAAMRRLAESVSRAAEYAQTI